MIDLTFVVASVILTLAIMTYIWYSFAAQKVSAEKLAEIQKWVEIAVQAAEMIYVGSGRGEEKKEYVVEFLKNKGFNIDTETIDAIIESTVLQLKYLLQK